LLEQTQAEAVLARLERLGDADEQCRVLMGIAFLVARGDEATHPSAGVHVDAERLNGADDDVRTEVHRRGEHAE
jgi:hypothetical protein